jgi:hypothetical protein
MTDQTAILSALVHKSRGSVPWTLSEAKQRVRGATNPNTLYEALSEMKERGLVESVPLYNDGKNLAWQITPAGLAQIGHGAKPTAINAITAITAKPKPGTLADVALLVAMGKDPQDALRAVMRKDPAYHPGNRLPPAMEKQQLKGEARRKDALARVTEAMRGGSMSVSKCADQLGLPREDVTTAFSSLRIRGVIERVSGPSNIAGAIWRMTEPADLSKSLQKVQTWIDGAKVDDHASPVGTIIGVILEEQA